MAAWSDLRQRAATLLSLLEQGGLEVRTPDGPIGSAAIRTVIQFDADVVTIVYAEKLTGRTADELDALAKRHWASVSERLAGIGDLASGPGPVGWVGSIASSLVPTIAAFVPADFDGTWHDDYALRALPLSIGLIVRTAHLWLPRLVMWGVSRWMRPAI